MKTTLVMVAVLLVLAGCGAAPARMSDRDRVEGAIEQYFHAASIGRGEIACPLLTSQARHGFRKLLDGPVARDCNTNIVSVARASLPLHHTSVSRVVVNGDRATAYVTSAIPPYSNTVTLVRVGSSWKLLYLPTAIHRSQPARVPARHVH